jgi:hypothetical protein
VPDFIFHVAKHALPSPFEKYCTVISSLCLDPSFIIHSLMNRRRSKNSEQSFVVRPVRANLLLKNRFFTLAFGTQQQS